MIVSNRPGVETLSIYTLGGVTIELRHLSNTAASTTNPLHQRLHFRTRTEEALLIYLASQGRALGREILAELLWPERTQEQARANLRLAIHRLREQIEPYLLVTRQSVAINPDMEIFLDVSHFEAQLAAGQLMAATALYRGDFLDGFYQDGSPTFEQWALFERERLRNLAIAAYQQLIDQTATAGQLDAAIAYAQRLLSLDSLHEPTHRQLMRLLAQAGQRSAALAQYESCRHLLAAELGVAPDATTTALHQQIRDGAGSVAQEQTGAQAGTAAMSALAVVIDDFSPARPPAMVAHNLPLQPTPLIGRQAELAQIESLLANPDCRLLTLLGVGGIGKTRLAIEAAQRIVSLGTAPTNNPKPTIQKPAFADGVCFVSLASVGRAELAPVTIAQALGLATTSSDLETEIVAFLRPRELLLIIDNFEHLLEAADTIANLLQNAARLKVLITSRERLYLREEWLLPVSGLSLAQGTTGEAGQLFLHSVQRVQPDFTASGQEDAVADICRQVEGMPLALELAASWVRVMPCDEIARQIAESSTFLTTSLRNLPERHRSVRALFDQSWRLLSPLEQGVLMRLSVFAGRWMVEEAAAVSGATPALLLGLVDKSLVRVNGQNRFDLHELVRQYAAEQLLASGEVEVIRQRHFEAYLQLIRTADRKLRGPEARAWYVRLESDQDNLRAALQWALDAGRYAEMAWLGISLHHFWYTCGHWVEGARWLEPLLAHRHALTTEARLATLLTLYTCWHALGDFASIDRYMDELMHLLDLCPLIHLRAAGWRQIAVSTSDLSQATAAWERCIALARAAAMSERPDDEFGVLADGGYQLAVALMRYAIRLIDVGAYLQAATLSSEGLELLQRQGNRDFIDFGFGNLGRLALIRGDVKQARHLLHEAVTIAAEIGNRLGLGDWQPRLGIVTLYAGDLEEARRLLTEGLGLCMGLKGDLVLSRVYTYLAEMALWEGKLDQAEEWLAQSVTHHAHPRWIRIELVECLWVAARLASAQQRFVHAATIFGLAEELRQRTHYESIGPVRLLADEALATVQAALEPARFSEAFSAGEHLSLEVAFATLLAPAHIAATLDDS